MVIKVIQKGSMDGMTEGLLEMDIVITVKEKDKSAAMAFARSQLNGKSIDSGRIELCRFRCYNIVRLLSVQWNTAVRTEESHVFEVYGKMRVLIELYPDTKIELPLILTKIGQWPIIRIPTDKSQYIVQLVDHHWIATSAPILLGSSKNGVSKKRRPDIAVESAN